MVYFKDVVILCVTWGLESDIGDVASLRHYEDLHGLGHLAASQRCGVQQLPVLQHNKQNK